MKPPNLPNKESRFLPSSIELRAESDDSPKKVFGYAAKFNARSENLGTSDRQFFEIIEPGAFDEVLLDDVRALFNHDANAILARSKNGTGSLKLGADETGLWYEFVAPDTQAGRDLMTSLQRGDVDQSSFSFTVNADGQKWDESRNGDGPTIFTRTISKVSRLYDVSPVTYPAYPDATVALRSLENFQQSNQEKPDSNEEENSLSHWQRRMGLIDKTAIQ